VVSLKAVLPLNDEKRAVVPQNFLCTTALLIKPEGALLFAGTDQLHCSVSPDIHFTFQDSVRQEATADVIAAQNEVIVFVPSELNGK
jgi:hypothetical protein